ncbi:molybdenum ABC transporter ATP-binding protein [Arenibacterium sp. LLYu02]|uniref:molybdenum ABC transporter ATP-binding protein n=1 Tax=Arenibacterium sp. LLYu02 TaxID=3404132 RepID=UPI003B2243B6
MSFQVDISVRTGAFQLEAQFETDQGITVLFGRSGSGKTTLINAVAGLVLPTRGHIRVAGRTLFDSAVRQSLPPQNRRLGYIFQDARLFPHLSVARNLRYGMRFGARRGHQGADFDQIVGMLGLNALLDRAPSSLSGGERQRVAIGRALLAAPEVILADEPLAALDTRRKMEIMPYFERIRDELQLPILYVSHSPAEVARLASTVVVLDKGRVTQVGTPGDVLSDPAVAPMGVRNLGSVVHAQLVTHHADGLSELDAAGLRLFVPRVGAPIGATLRLRIAAHDIILANRAPEGLSALNVFPGTVHSVRTGEGPGALVTLMTDAGPIVARITQRSASALGFSEGKQAFAIVKSVALAPEDISG